MKKFNRKGLAQNKLLLTSAFFIIFFIALGSIVYVATRDAPEETYEAARSDLTNTVSFSGSVSPAERVSVAFEISGVASRVYVENGEIVSSGAMLAELGATTARTQLASAEATLRSEEALLSEYRRGTRAEEIAVGQRRVESAEQAYTDSGEALAEEYIDAFTTADTAVRNYADRMFSNPRLNPDLLFDSPNYQLANDVVATRRELEGVLARWSETVDELREKMNQAFALDEEYSEGGIFAFFSRASQSANALFAQMTENTIDYEAYQRLSKGNLTEVKEFLEDLALLVGSLSPGASLTQTTIDSWMSAVTTARSSTTSQLSALTVQKEKRNSAESAYLLAEEELTLLESGATEETIRAQEARVAAQEALVAQYRDALAKHTLRAPIAGVIGGRELERGEVVSANNPILTITSEAEYEIDADVSELDIAGLEVGMPVTVTLDAFGPTIEFQTTITHIDTVETLVRGIPTYGVTLQFQGDSSGVRSGMTANADAEVLLGESILFAPRRFLTTHEDGSYTILLESSEGQRERKVQIGRQSNSGMVEIISGLSEGDTLLRYDNKS